MKRSRRPQVLRIIPVLISLCLASLPAQAKYSGGTGKTTVKIHTASSFLESGWDLVGEMANGTDDIWSIDEGEDYPRLRWEWKR